MRGRRRCAAPTGQRRRRAQTAAYQVGNELSQTAASYQQQDHAQSAAFDAKIPGSPQRGWGYDLQSTDKKNAPAYTDINDPQGRLTEPKDYLDDMQWKPTLQSDAGNVVSFVRGVIQWIIGVDPLQSCEQLAAGNWVEIRQFSDRFNNASWAFRDCADNIQNAQNSSEQDWTGNAADGARNYLVQLADGFVGEAERHKVLADQLKDFAEGVFDAMKILTDILGDWVNAKFLPAIASLGIAGATEEIPVVDLITDGRRMEQSAPAMRGLDRIMKHYMTLSPDDLAAAKAQHERNINDVAAELTEADQAAHRPTPVPRSRRHVVEEDSWENKSWLE